MSTRVVSTEVAYMHVEGSLLCYDTSGAQWCGEV